VNRQIGLRLVTAVAAFVVAFDSVALVTGYLNVGLAPKLGGLVFAGGVALWLYRRERVAGAPLPRAWEVALVCSVAVAVGFAAAWWTQRPKEAHEYDFIAVPKAAATLPSLAPRGQTAVDTLGFIQQGSRLIVTCEVTGPAGNWYRLDSGYFISAREAMAAPYSKQGSPPAC
jgi:hypothetical protein